MCFSLLIHPCVDHPPHAPAEIGIDGSGGVTPGKRLFYYQNSLCVCVWVGGDSFMVRAASDVFHIK